MYILESFSRLFDLFWRLLKYFIGSGFEEWNQKGTIKNILDTIKMAKISNSTAEMKLRPLSADLPIPGEKRVLLQVKAKQEITTDVFFSNKSS